MLSVTNLFAFRPVFSARSERRFNLIGGPGTHLKINWGLIRLIWDKLLGRL